jgi:hypothetical protein
VSMSRQKLVVIGLVLAGFACFLPAAPSFADSQVRIVRLSDVEATVQIDRNTGQGYEKAFLNSPITEGTKLRTDRDARAEVEFEDASTLRITPGTVVEFPVLSLRDSGVKASTVNVKDGTAYLNFTGAKDEEFMLTFGHEKVALSKPAHLRVEMKDASAIVAVFKGDVRVEGPSGAVEVGKKQAVTFALDDQDRSTVAKNFEPDPYDSWDQQQSSYHQQYSSRSYSSYSPYAYGVSDLNYYGNFFSVPGYGMMWQPYFAGAGWDPFMNGAYLWYPGFGYTWVSAYPWGWTPYRYGSWRFLPGYGWAWQPTNLLTGWRPIPAVVNPPRQFTQPQPPSAPGHTTIVSRGPVATSIASSHQLLIHDDSAGLGIPRGKVGDLARLSQQVKTEGFATAAVHAVPVRPSASMSPGFARGGGSNSASHMSTAGSHSTSGSHTGSHK